MPSRHFNGLFEEKLFAPMPSRHFVGITNISGCKITHFPSPSQMFLAVFCRLMQLCISMPPFIFVVFQKFLLSVPIVMIPIRRMSYAFFLRIVNQPMRWAKTTTDVMPVLMLIVRVVLQILEHLLRCNPIVLFHNLFCRKGRRSPPNRQII